LLHGASFTQHRAVPVARERRSPDAGDQPLHALAVRRVGVREVAHHEALPAVLSIRHGVVDCARRPRAVPPVSEGGPMPYTIKTGEPILHITLLGTLTNEDLVALAREAMDLER